MTTISSVGLGIPEYDLSQMAVKQLVRDIFDYPEEKLMRLLPVFENAEVTNRQFVVSEDWFKHRHTFQEKNDLYQKYAVRHSLEAIDDCLTNNNFLTEAIPFEAIDAIIYVSSTGIATPSIETYLMNERPFREDVVRMPLWGLGCAGGAVGLSRTFDWLRANPSKIALIVCCELCSLTFQKDDIKKSNLIGTALFGDGVAAALMIGDKSEYQNYINGTKPAILKASSCTKKNSSDVMGWKITDKGLEVIFSKSIPSLVNTFWKHHVNSFLKDNYLISEKIHSVIAHPGGKKVLDAIEDVLSVTSEKLLYSHEILRKHGNMSSATVLYVLREWLNKTIPKEELSVLSALGPGFSSELLLMEWK